MTLVRTLIVCLALSLIWSYTAQRFFAQSDYWWLGIVVCFVLFSALIILMHIKGDPDPKTGLLFGAIGVKALLMLLTIVLFAILQKGGLRPFVIHFGGHYILFTVFEIRYLLCFKDQSKI